FFSIAIAGSSPASFLGCREKRETSVIGLSRARSTSQRALGVFACIVLLCASLAAWSATVEVFSPQGTIKDVRQVAVRFSEPMVAFGDPRLPEPFDIDCASHGS